MRSKNGWKRVECPPDRWVRVVTIENDTGETQMVQLAIDAPRGTELRWRTRRPWWWRFERTVIERTIPLSGPQVIGFGNKLPRWSLHLRIDERAQIDVMISTRPDLRLTFPS